MKHRAPVHLPARRRGGGVAGGGVACGGSAAAGSEASDDWILGSASPSARSQWDLLSRSGCAISAGSKVAPSPSSIAGPRGDRSAISKLQPSSFGLNVDVIVSSAVGAAAAKQATSVIPIVFAVAVDPLGTGLVKSLARPGENVTGLSSQQTTSLVSESNSYAKLSPGSGDWRLWPMLAIQLPHYNCMRLRQQPDRSVWMLLYWKSGASRMSHRLSTKHQAPSGGALSLFRAAGERPPGLYQPLGTRRTPAYDARAA